MDLGGIIGTFLGVLGIVFAFVFYFKGKRKKKLIYNTESTVLISENLSSYENLRISYNDKEITTLNSTTIKIKNIGNDIIEPNDFVPSTPIIIKVNGSFLLQDPTKYKIQRKNYKNIVSLEKKKENEIKVNFDFLKPKDEIQITVLHTGEVSISGDLKQGTVKNYSSKKYETTNLNVIDDDLDYSKYRHYSEYSSRNNSITNFWPRVLALLFLIISLTIIYIFIFEKVINGDYFNIKEPYLLVIPFLLLSIGTFFITFTFKK